MPVWIYVLRTGHLYSPSGNLFATGYAGNGPDENNPDDQFVKDHGPLPVDGYTMDTPLEGTHLGPCAIPLDPDNPNVLQGRSGFFMHDDSIAHPGQASDGCIVIAGASYRRQIWASPCHRLQVVAEETDVAAFVTPPTQGAHT